MTPNITPLTVYRYRRYKFYDSYDIAEGMISNSLAIEAVNLTKIFGSFKAVNRINLRVEEGVIFGLLGPNGAGKTTTIRMVLGLLRPTAGWVKVFGIDVEKNRKKVLQVTGYMPQYFSLYEDLTVEENLRLYASLYGLRGEALKERINELLDEFQLREFRGRLAGKLSGGMKQRLALSVALVHKPRLLVVDEPTAGVDPNVRRYFWEYFKRLKEEGVTILLTTHYMDEAENCDKLALMSRGRIIAEGSPQEVKRLAFGGDFIEVLLESKNSLNLGELEGVIGVAEEERRDGLVKLRLLVDDASERLASILRFFESKGTKVHRAYQVHVSLEDAFIALTTRG